MTFCIVINFAAEIDVLRFGHEFKDDLSLPGGHVFLPDFSRCHVSHLKKRQLTTKSRSCLTPVRHERAHDSLKTQRRKENHHKKRMLTHCKVHKGRQDFNSPSPTHSNWNGLSFGKHWLLTSLTGMKTFFPSGNGANSQQR
jgi:hypothetical protein